MMLGFVTTIAVDDLSKGIRAEYIEVLIAVKPGKVETLDVIP